ncbi:RING finger protein 24-like isoform X2 [Apostichopus japonicus]
MDMDLKHVLPFFIISGFIVLLNVIFCCYLARLKREGKPDTGYREVKYKKKRVLNETCAVCLEDFRSGEKIGYCPCKHGFHILCISKWLESKNSCPVCKAPPKTLRPTENSFLVLI